MSDTSAQAQPEAPLVVTEAQVRGAMQQMEQLHGRGDGISISREVACLADLLGEMWFAREGEAQVPSGSKVGRLLLQAVPVLAVGTKLKTDGTANTGARTVTLALRADVLSDVALAARIGTVSLAIRNMTDQDNSAATMASLDTLMGSDRAAADPAPARHAAARGGDAITVYSGRAQASVRASP